MCFLLIKKKSTFDSNIYENIISIINVPFPLRDNNLVCTWAPFCLTSDFNMTGPGGMYTVYTSDSTGRKYGSLK